MIPNPRASSTPPFRDMLTLMMIRMRLQPSAVGAAALDARSVKANILDGAETVAKAEMARRQTTPAGPTIEKLEAFTNWLVGAQVRADCFFVTTAHLLRTTVQDISTRTGIDVPQPGTNGVSLETMIQALTTLGLRFRVLGKSRHRRSFKWPCSKSPQSRRVVKLLGITREESPTYCWCCIPSS